MLDEATRTNDLSIPGKHALALKNPCLKKLSRTKAETWLSELVEETSWDLEKSCHYGF